MTRVLTTLRAIHTAAGNVLPNTKLYLGPQAEMPTEKNLLIVGTDDPLAAGVVTAIDTGGRDWLDLGALHQEETFAVHCSLVLWTGAATYTTLLDDADTALAALETEMKRHDNTALVMGATAGALGATGWCVLSVASVRLIQANTGAALHVHFVISCTTRV